MNEYDLIFISQSDIVNYEEYSRLPVDRIELFRDLVFPRMVYFKNGFHHSLDIINYFRFGSFYADADYPLRQKMLNIWNLPGFNGSHIASYLLRFGIKTKVINNFDSDWDRFCGTYEKCAKKPLIGISTTFYLSYAEIRRISKKIHQAYPEARIVLGGAFINEQSINVGADAFEAAMRKYHISYILHAFNSEIDLKDLIISIKTDTGTDRVNNLCCIERDDFTSGTFITTDQVWNDPVLDDAGGLYDAAEYPSASHTIQTRTTSGCPFNCAFCSYPRTAGGFHTATNEAVGRQIDAIAALPGVNKIVFIDDTFNVPISRFKEILRHLKELHIEWFSFLRAQFVDEETVQLMKESGCRAVYLGVESASDRVLENMNKKATRAQYLNGIRLLKKYGICTISAIILGFPGETKETLKEDIDFIENSGNDYYTLKEFYYMKHTSIYQDRDKYGLTGLGSDWQHATMDRTTASEAKLEMFAAIKNSTFIDPDTSLWHIAYLYDQGFPFDTILKIQKEINSIIKEQISGHISDDNPAFDNIKRLVNVRPDRLVSV